jgi:hypothetical protein
MDMQTKLDEINHCYRDIRHELYTGSEIDLSIYKEFYNELNYVYDNRRELCDFDDWIIIEKTLARRISWEIFEDIRFKLSKKYNKEDLSDLGLDASEEDRNLVSKLFREFFNLRNKIDESFYIIEDIKVSLVKLSDFHMKSLDDIFELCQLPPSWFELKVMKYIDEHKDTDFTAHQIASELNINQMRLDEYYSAIRTKLCQAAKDKLSIDWFKDLNNWMYCSLNLVTYKDLVKRGYFDEK